MADYEVTEETKERSKLSKEEWKNLTTSVWNVANVTHDEHPAMYPAEIPKRLIKLFSFDGETVLDPFCGVSTTGLACAQSNRKYIGVDINDEYIQISQDRLSDSDIPSDEYSLHHHDSSKMEFLEEASVNLIITSPPYWNKADYGDVDGDVGQIDNYAEFLNEMKPILAECERVLDPGRRFCLVTADVHQNTKDGLLTFPLSADFINIARDVGLRLVNKVVWSKDGTGGKWGSANNQKPIFGSYPYPPNFLFKNVHEYVLIFKKQGEKKSNSGIPSYEELMKNGTQGSNSVSE